MVVLSMLESTALRVPARSPWGTGQFPDSASVSGGTVGSGGGGDASWAIAGPAMRAALNASASARALTRGLVRGMLRTSFRGASELVSRSTMQAGRDRDAALTLSTYPLAASAAAHGSRFRITGA